MLPVLAHFEQQLLSCKTAADLRRLVQNYTVEDRTYYLACLWENPSSAKKLATFVAFALATLALTTETFVAPASHIRHIISFVMGGAATATPTSQGRLRVLSATAITAIENRFQTLLAYEPAAADIVFTALCEDETSYDLWYVTQIAKVSPEEDRYFHYLQQFIKTAMLTRLPLDDQYHCVSSVLRKVAPKEKIAVARDMGLDLASFVDGLASRINVDSAPFLPNNLTL